jgi:hypothetical protein
LNFLHALPLKRACSLQQGVAHYEHRPHFVVHTVRGQRNHQMGKSGLGGS